jgi:two-component system chemotaxis response regulator CheB
MPPRPIRVLIVDDSAVVRRLAAEALAADPGIEVVGTAADPYIARDKVRELEPDVMTLDLEMPRMDGLTFLRLLMESRPMPVIVMSSLTQRGSEYALEALQLGAVDVIAKPAGSFSFGDFGPRLIAGVRSAAGARLASPRALILLGASTGGTEALREVLTALPDGLPPIAIVQHIPATFSRAFADRLNQLCACEVREAVDGDLLRPGLALVAPGNFHLLIQRRGPGYAARVVTGPQVWHQRPAVDLLFKSAVECGAAPHALAGVLTGMGKDGAEGLKLLRAKGAATFAQDEATSVVYGMPKAAFENGGARHVLPLSRIAAHLLRHSGTPTARTAAEARPEPAERALP